jgi:hypothetical protein
VTIPSNVTNMGTNVFSACTGLANVTIGNGVTRIGTNMFNGCTSLTNIMIGNGVTNIGEYAFQMCSKLTNVTIPNNVSNIGRGAFLGCANLTNVTIGNGVTSIGRVAFSGCFKLTAITVDPLNSAFSSMDGVVFDKGQATVVLCPQGRAGAYKIPNTVTSIGDYAFFYCRSLTSVTIPNGVTNIGDYAFYFCSSLTAAYFGGNAPMLGGSSVFTFSWATLYYLLGATGWSPAYSDSPIALWLPQMEATDASFGVRTNRFGFNILWASGMVIVVETCTNLADLNWSPLQTNILNADCLYFGDPQWTNYPNRFYRLRSQ